MGSSQRCRLLLVVLVLATEAASSPTHCLCTNKVHMLRCSGCSSLPQFLPAGVPQLSMSGNRVSRVHFDENVSLPDLKSVSLDYNNIVALHNGDLCALKNLMVLDLSGNNLLSIEEESITCNSKLKKLVLDNNTRLKLVALRSRSLEQLYLENCGLTSFDPELLKHLPNLRGLHLRGNDALPSHVVQDIRKRWPYLNVYCDDKPSATKNASITTTDSSEASIDNKSNTRPIPVLSDDRPFQVPIRPKKFNTSPRSESTDDHPSQVVTPLQKLNKILVGVFVVSLAFSLFIFCKKSCSDVLSCKRQPHCPH